MKIGLSYKFFAAFLTTSLMIVGLIIAMQYYAFQNFADYVSKVELENLDELVSQLGKKYELHGKWDFLKRHPRNWKRILKASGLGRPPGPPPRPLFPGAPPHDPPPEGYPGKGHPKGLFRDGKRISLFDADEHRVIGNPTLEEQVLREIRVNGEIVGWVGLRKKERPSRPLETAFLKQQHRLFFIAGGCILLITTLVSLLLSQHLLRPIRHLIRGTQALASRHFETRIPIRSSDELAQLADDFNNMAQTLEKYEQVRQQWISDISHELRTPLAILRGEIEAIQDGIREMNPETTDSLHSETIHLSRLVDDLHRLSLADSQNLSMRKEPVRPLRILKETLNMFQTRLDQHETDVRMRLADGEDIAITGDPDHLTRLFSNILENTLRYADAPGILKIWEKHDGDRLIICLEDSGPGVPEESVERLFERLYRVDRSRSRALGGSGLGLSICKQIVERHSGNIRAMNAASGGLRIEITFPLA